MRNPSEGGRIGLLMVAVVAAGAGTACAPKPFVLDGDADYARVTYTGDLPAATAAAQRHCSQFERVARFREIEESAAYFFCVKP